MEIVEQPFRRGRDRLMGVKCLSDRPVRLAKDLGVFAKPPVERQTVLRAGRNVLRR
jgi:hypothetical protein